MTDLELLLNDLNERREHLENLPFTSLQDKMDRESRIKEIVSITVRVQELILKNLTND